LAAISFSSSTCFAALQYRSFRSCAIDLIVEQQVTYFYLRYFFDGVKHIIISPLLLSFAPVTFLIPLSVLPFVPIHEFP